MVFERSSYTPPSETPIGSVSGIINNYNNTNASGYINRIRINELRKEYNLKNGYVCHKDVPPN